MAATATVVTGQTYPAGTKVKAFALPALLTGEFLKNLDGSPGSAPYSLTELGEATVTNAALSFTGLEPSIRYLLWAEVAGKQVTMFARGVGTTAVAATSPNTVKVKTTSTELLKLNAAREGLEIVNAGTTNMYLGVGKAAVLKEGILLTPGGSWDGRLGPEPGRGERVWDGSVFGIAETAEESATVLEF